MIDIILKARFELQRQMVPKPWWIRVSPEVHELLLSEINMRDGRKPIKIFEIYGMKLDIDPDCPAWTGYAGGTDENREAEVKDVVRRSEGI
jgi:hypothetical protein